MAYVIPTAATLKARFDAFAAVVDATVNERITEALRQVDETWTEGDYTLGIMLYAAHLLAGGGDGTDLATQLAGFKRVKIGPLELELASASTTGALPGSLETTIYGVQFAALRLQNVGGGPLIV